MMSSTPLKPPARASQVRAGTRSPSSGPPASATMIGARNTMLATSAICMWISATTNTTLLSTSISPRTSCRPGAVVRTSRRPMRGRKITIMARVCRT